MDIESELELALSRFLVAAHMGELDSELVHHVTGPHGPIQRDGVYVGYNELDYEPVDSEWAGGFVDQTCHVVILSQPNMNWSMSVSYFLVRKAAAQVVNAPQGSTIAVTGTYAMETEQGELTYDEAVEVITWLNTQMSKIRVDLAE